jgi:hypothetical protein
MLMMSIANFLATGSSMLRGSALVTTGVLLASCTTTSYESYRPVQNPNVDIVYVGTNADFSIYRRLMVEEMGIFFPTAGAPSDADVQRVRKAFQQAFRAKTEGYEIVQKPAADVLKVKASLVDLRNATPMDVPNIGSDINRILAPGKLTFMIEMRDSRSGNLLLRAADTEKSPKIDLPEDGSANPDEVNAAAQHWAQLFRNFLDTNLKPRAAAS